MGNIFTGRFLMIITGVLVLSSAFSYTFLDKSRTAVPSMMQSSSSPAANVNNNVDARIDEALEYSLNGQYQESFPILKELADADVTRAKLYLAVAYYHGHGTEKNKAIAKTLMLELQNKNYEPGIVNTYLNLIAYTEAHPG